MLTGGKEVWLITRHVAADLEFMRRLKIRIGIKVGSSALIGLVLVAVWFGTRPVSVA
jgi:hypothetical protein